MKKASLNKKFVLIFLSIITAVFVVMLIAVQLIAQIVTKDYLENDIRTTHTVINRGVTDTMNEINFGYTRMVQSDLLSSFAEGDVNARKQIFPDIVENAFLSENYVNVVLCLNDEVYSITDTDLPSKSFCKQIAQSENILSLGEINSRVGYVQLGRKFQSSFYGLNGQIIFYLSTNVFSNYCAQTDAKVGYTQLLTDDYTIIAKSNGQNIGQTITEKSKLPLAEDIFTKNIDGKTCRVAVTPISNQYNTNWYLVSVLDNSILQHDFIVLSWVLGAIAAVGVGFTVYFAVKVAHSTTAPINKLSQKISSVDFQSKQTLAIGAEGDELFELERNYDEMLQRLIRLMDENKDNMEAQRKLEMDALQMQINPHFLYNTLDAIAWMAKIKKQPEIEKLVINLAKFFRLSLHKGDKFVTITEETELVGHFLEIEKIRFPDTINYICQIEDGVGDYKMLKLVLQPIVENSIKHGFAGKEDVGTIKIEAHSQGEDIIIDVSDDGCGFDVTPDFWTIKTDKPNGFGLYNVHERIRLEYGEGYGLDITSQKGIGTTVRVKIAKR